MAWRALRAWLHTTRDRLTVASAADFAAQLPELLRGVYFDGWEPLRVPVKFGPEDFVQRFAREARLPVDEVPEVAAAVTRVIGAHTSPSQVPHVLAQLPAGLRTLLEVHGPPAQEPDVRAPDIAGRLTRLEEQLQTLAEALSVLVGSLERIPGEPADEHRQAKAARTAHEILLSAKR